MTPVALTIAGSDPSGGAGLQGDLATFHQHRVHGAAVVTLLTVQSTRGVRRVEVLDAELVAAQLDEVLEDLHPAAMKTGALGTADIVAVVAARAARSAVPLVVDPVVISTSGERLLTDDALDALRIKLLPHALLVTPNAPEAEVLSGTSVKTMSEAREAARRIAAFGVKAVLIKGGHLEGDAVDGLWVDGTWTELSAPRAPGGQVHGTGCALSAAIVANLARGASLLEAVSRGKAWLTHALTGAQQLGGGASLLNFWAALEPASTTKP